MKRLVASAAAGTLLFSLYLALMALLFAQPESAPAERWAWVLASPLIQSAAITERVVCWLVPGLCNQASLLPLMTLALPLLCLPFIAALSLPAFLCLGWLRKCGPA